MFPEKHAARWERYGISLEEINEAVYEVIVEDLHDFVNALCFSGIF